MVTTAELLIDAFERVRDGVHHAVDHIGQTDLLWRPDPNANSIGWLIWHLSRVEDDHVAGVAGQEQVWLAGGWCERFGLPYDDHAHGYGQSSEEVGAFRVASGNLLLSYHDAVHAQTISYVTGLSDTDLDRIVDERWNPPVTLAVRLVSVISDALQHCGQAAYIHGLVTRAA
jgi:hypothetical protein